MYFLDLNNEKTFLLMAIDNFAMFSPKSINSDCICGIAWKQIFPLTDTKEI